MMNVNNCDLEEVKHVALQKFLELAEDPSNYKRKKDQNGFYSDFTEVGNFRLARSYTGFGLGSNYSISLVGESLFSEYAPSYPKKYHDYPFGNNSVNSNYEKELSEYASKELEFKSKPEVVTIDKVFDYYDKIWCEKRERDILEAANKSCLKIQEALENPNIIIYESNKEGFWRKLIRYLRS